jgi:hypothetical protein
VEKQMIQKELIESLQRLAKKLDTQNISKSMIDADKDTPSSSTYKRTFGSWSNALFLAGLKTGKITGRPWDESILISDDALEIIEGELLGDGGLEQPPTSGNPGFAHSTANIHYSIYLEQRLAEANISVHLESLPSRNGGKPQRRIRTQYNQSFRHLYDHWYPQGIKVIPKNLILTKTKCLHWYLGDGYVEGKNAKLSTCGFKWEEVQQLTILLKMLGFKASVDRHSGGYPVLRFLTADSQAFLNWLGPCPVLGYEHRWNLSR